MPGDVQERNRKTRESLEQLRRELRRAMRTAGGKVPPVSPHALVGFRCDVVGPPKKPVDIRVVKSALKEIDKELELLLAAFR